MIDKFLLELKDNKKVNFKVNSFHYLNPDLRNSFNSEYPTIAVLYKWVDNKTKLKISDIVVIDNPKLYFNSNPIEDKLKEVVIILTYDDNLPSPKNNALEYLENIKHEIIDSFYSQHTFLQFGYLPYKD
jgi:hypothetical protein